MPAIGPSFARKLTNIGHIAKRRRMMDDERMMDDGDNGDGQCNEPCKREGTICTICQDVIDKSEDYVCITSTEKNKQKYPKPTRCHVFHKECFDGLVSSSSTPRCPNCRGEVVKVDEVMSCEKRGKRKKRKEKRKRKGVRRKKKRDRRERDSRRA